MKQIIVFFALSIFTFSQSLSDDLAYQIVSDHLEGSNVPEAYIREADTVRKTVGICDVTSLGKISIQGPDSTELLNRIYTNPFAKLAIGKTRYGIMLRDDGLVMDDGTAWRLSLIHI